MNVSLLVWISFDNLCQMLTNLACSLINTTGVTSGAGIVPFVVHYCNLFVVLLWFQLISTAYPSGAPTGVDPGFQVRGRSLKIAPSGGRCENVCGISCEKSRIYAKKSYFFQSLVLYVGFVDRCSSFCTFSFGHRVTYSSSIYGFWLPLWYLQTLLSWNEIPENTLFSKFGCLWHDIYPSPFLTLFANLFSIKRAGSLCWCCKSNYHTITTMMDPQ